MVCGCRNSFKEVSHFGVTGPINKLEKNLQFFIDYSLLLIGAWVDIKQGFPGPNGEDASILMPVHCYPGGVASQGWRSNWVYESAVTYTDLDSNTHSPIVPVAADPINYLYGYVEGTLAAIDYSAKQVSVVIGAESPWWKEIQLNSWEIPESFAEKNTCGIWAVNSPNRVQLPAIVIEAVPGGSTLPKGLGECGNFFKIPINLHVLSDIKCDMQNIMDILLAQEGSTICLFDPDFAELPLDCNGFLNPSGLQYPELLETYDWGCARITSVESRGFSTITDELFEGIVRWNIDVYKG